MSLRNIQGVNASHVGHQVLHLSGAPNREQALGPHHFRRLLARTQRPQRIIQAVVIKDDSKRNWIVMAMAHIRLALAVVFLARDVTSDVVVAVDASVMLAQCLECRCDHLALHC